jgi:hypothetical protein
MQFVYKNTPGHQYFPFGRNWMKLRKDSIVAYVSGKIRRKNTENVLENY